MTKILCPTDFTDTGNNGVAYAAKFCQATGSSLKLLHVQSLFALSPIEVVGAKSDSVEEIRIRLEQQRQEVERVFRISCEAELHATAKLLSSVIEKTAIGHDLIIMGTAGKRDLFSFLAGSNTYQAIRNTNIPVLFVPNNYVYSAIEKIVYAYNYVGEVKLPMLQLSLWVKMLRASLDVLDVVDEAVSKDLEEALRDMQEVIQLQNPETPIQFSSVRSGHKFGSIHNHMVRTNADLLVLCTKPRGMLGSIFHKSVIKSINQVATYPVLVVHE